MNNHSTHIHALNRIPAAYTRLNRKVLELICLLIWISLIPAPISAISGENENQVYQPGDDAIRILLFEDSPTGKLTLQAYDGSIQLTCGGNRRSFSAEGASITVTANSRDLGIRFLGKRYRSDRCRVTSLDENALIRVRHPKHGYRYYHGKLDLQVYRKKGASVIRAINTTPLETYVGSVIGGEMEFKHPTALKVQAVISRTYALWNMQKARTSHYDLTDHTLSQIFPGVLIQKPRFAEAARTTHAEILSWSNKIPLAAFSSTCGGHTVNNEEVWRGDPLPYLRGVNDHEACKASPHYRWSYKIEKEELQQFLQTNFGVSGFKNIEIGDVSANGRAKTIVVSLGDGRTDSLAANTFRLQFTRRYGIRSLKSAWFRITEVDGKVLFRGKGMGHGIGLCQWGALGLAESGWDYRQILKFYYKGVIIVDYHALEAPLRNLPLAK